MKPKYAIEMSIQLWPKSTNPDPTPADMPDNWEAMTLRQLQWQAENGSYAQRLIAGRYIHGHR